jgi:hypothetical protein
MSANWTALFPHGRTLVSQEVSVASRQRTARHQTYPHYRCRYLHYG